jgi:tetratricopeptide (TPR) repeat protein
MKCWNGRANGYASAVKIRMNPFAISPTLLEPEGRYLPRVSGFIGVSLIAMLRFKRSPHRIRKLRVRVGGCLSWLSLVLLSFLATNHPRVAAADARQIFGAVAPSTVQIRTLDSGGSGVVLNDRGLILTNLHVVASNIEIKVRAKVRFAGKIMETEIADVRILKVHPTYDLALLEAKSPQGYTFIPARIIPKNLALAPGARCFAIGNPGGPGGNALELSITEGIVSSASRDIEGLSYIQFSAAINPGNSGGPVCDDQGRVFGIATWKMTESEGLGFAIPTTRISLAEFVDPSARKPNLAVARQAVEIGGRYNMLSDLADGQEREILLWAAAECFRVAMQAAPEELESFTRLAKVYQKLGKSEIAKRYVEGALKLAPNNGWACHLFGEISIRGQENDKKIVDQCIQVWFRGLTNDPNKVNAAWCAHDIGVTLQKQGSALSAAYMLRWADVLFSGTDSDARKNERKIAWEALEKTLPEDQIEAIRGKNDGFTRAEFASLNAGKPLPVTATPSIPSVTQEQVDQIVRSAAQRFGPTQVSVPADGLEIPLPDTPERAVLAYAGWKAVISFPDLLKLGILNLSTGKIDGFIDCDDRRTIFAAGGQLLATYSPASQNLEVYDLETLQKIIAKRNPRPGPIVFIGMGLLNPTRLFVLHFETTGFPPYFSPAFLKLPDLAPFELRPSIKNENNPLRTGHSSADAFMDGSMDERGNIAVVTHHRSNLYHYIPKENGRLGFFYAHSGFEATGLAHGGAFVLGRGQVVHIGTEKDRYHSTLREGSNPYRLVPIAGYPAFVEFRTLRSEYVFRVFGLPSMNKILTTTVAPEVGRRLSHRESHEQTEVVLASSYCDRIAYIMPMEKRVILFPLGLKGSEAGGGIAQPGKNFTRKVNFSAGSTVTVQSGPPGLQVDGKTGTMTWNVPADFKTGQTVQVIMLVKTADGKEEYAVEKITIP